LQFSTILSAKSNNDISLSMSNMLISTPVLLRIQFLVPTATNESRRKALAASLYQCHWLAIFIAFDKTVASQRQQQILHRRPVPASDRWSFKDSNVGPVESGTTSTSRMSEKRAPHAIWKHAQLRGVVVVGRCVMAVIFFWRPAENRFSGCCADAARRTFAFRADLLPCRGALALLLLRATITNSSDHRADRFAGRISFLAPGDSEGADRYPGISLEDSPSGQPTADQLPPGG